MTDVVLAAQTWAGVAPDVEALLDSWHVAEQDAVAQGQTLATVVLIKSTLEVLAPCDGVVQHILVPAEVTFKRGQVLATLTPHA